MGPEQVLLLLLGVLDTLRYTVYLSKMGFVIAIESFSLSSFVNVRQTLKRGKKP